MNQKEFDLKQHIKNSYDVKVPDYWDGIEKADISKIPQVAEKKNGWLLLISRTAAVAACMAFVITLSVLAVPRLFSEKSNLSNDQTNKYGITYGQDTPVRVGKLGSMNASFSSSCSFEEAFESADLVAEVIITEWLGELDEEGLGETTYFKATIIEEYKNSIGFQGNELILLQQGNSKWTYNGYPLFQNGDRLLLSLMWLDPVKEPAFAIGDDCYMIIAGQLTELYIVENESKMFALKNPMFGDFIEIEDLTDTDSIDILEILEEMLEQEEIISLQEAVLLSPEVEIEDLFDVYSLDELKNYMAELIEGEENE